ncbi:MAG TPA: 3-oxoacyl-ACP reductase [Lachnospiraceae bacterium]|nr:3-oxoacyl-ACP reductase [Lachnospiraceae bacterium]
MNRLEGKVAIVSGATAGIGKAIALLFGKNGCKVVASGRNEERGNAVVKEIKDNGGEAVFVKADICSESDLKNLVDTAVSTYGQLDIVVNNAGSGLSKPLSDITSEDWDHIFTADCKSVFLMMKFALPHLLKTRGNVINLSSASVYKPMPRMHGYCAAKAAVIELSKTAAMELAAQGVRVNVLCPGLTRTSILSQYTEEGVNRVAQAIPLKRVGEPEDIANMALFLASDEASYVTGQVMCVDGGVTTH